MTDGFGHVIFQDDSGPHRRVLKTLLLNSLILDFMPMFLDLHVLLSVANAWMAFEILVLIFFCIPAGCHFGTQVREVFYILDFFEI